MQFSDCFLVYSQICATITIISLRTLKKGFFLTVPCSMRTLFTNQGLNLCSLQWKHGLFLKIFIYLFLFLPSWVIVPAWAFLWLQYTGFSLWWLLCCGARALGLMGCSSFSTWALDYRLNNCGTWA